MEKLKVKAGTIARIVALAVALLNQCLVLFGQAVLPFTGELAYQIVTYVLTVIIVAANAWFNNDLSKFALVAGQCFDALKDGKLTPEEVEAFLAENKPE